jgi:nicotinamidase-related amidase
MPVQELLAAERSIVVVIDMQGKLMEVIHRPRLVIDATLRLLQLAEVFEVPVILTEQYPQGLGPTHPEVRAAFDRLTTPKFYVDKLSFSCCGEPRFMDALKEAWPGLAPTQRQVVIAGIETHVCVMQTVLELLQAEHAAYLCWECVSGRGEEYYRRALERMAHNGAALTNHESVAFEWARSSASPGFKQLNQLLRSGQLS